MCMGLTFVSKKVSLTEGYLKHSSIPFLEAEEIILEGMIKVIKDDSSTLQRYMDIKKPRAKVIAEFIQIRPHVFVCGAEFYITMSSTKLLLQEECIAISCYDLPFTKVYKYYTQLS